MSNDARKKLLDKVRKLLVSRMAKHDNPPLAEAIVDLYADSIVRREAALRQDIIEAVEKERKEFLWQAFDPDTGETELLDRPAHDDDMRDGCTVHDAWNAALDQAIQAIKDME